MASSLPKPSSFSSVIEHNISTPPTTPHPLHHHHHHCLTCFCCLFFLLLLLLLFTLFTISLRSSLLPFIPSFHLHRLNTTLTDFIPIYDGDGDAYVSVYADIVILICNGNVRGEMRYEESRVLVTAEGDEMRFEEAVVPGFRQVGGSLREVRVRAEVKESYLVAEYVGEMEKGEMPIGVEWRMRVNFVAGGEVFDRVPMSVVCEGVNMLKHPTKCTPKLFGRFPFN